MGDSLYTIGVDLDGVCYQSVAAFQKKFGLLNNKTYAEPDNYDLETVWELPKGYLLEQLIIGVKEKGFFWEGDPYPEAKPILNKLKKDNLINLISDRALPGIEKLCRKATLSWLKKPEVQIPFDNLIFARDKTSVQHDFLIDDYDFNVQAALDSGRGAALIKRPWNVNSHLPRYTWEEIPELIENHKKNK